MTNPASRQQLHQLADTADSRLLYRLAADFRSAAADLPPDPPAVHIQHDVPFDLPFDPPMPRRHLLAPTPGFDQLAQVLGLRRRPSTAPTDEFDLGHGTSPTRMLADQFLKAKDLDGLRTLALPSNDSYVRRRLEWLLDHLGLEDELLDLAVFSTRGARTVAESLVRQGRLADLLRQVVCGNGFAVRALRDWQVEGLDDDDRARLFRQGLNPDGSLA